MSVSPPLSPPSPSSSHRHRVASTSHLVVVVVVVASAFLLLSSSSSDAITTAEAASFVAWKRTTRTPIAKSFPLPPRRPPGRTTTSTAACRIVGGGGARRGVRTTTGTPPANPYSCTLSMSSENDVDVDININDRASTPPATTGMETGEVKEGGRDIKRRRRVAILLCPAQFCVPADYTALLDEIRMRITAAATNDDGEGTIMEVVATRVAPLPRTEWIKVARQLPTLDFLNANLSARRTLGWYFDAMEIAFSELFAEASSSSASSLGGGGGTDDVEICVIGHSIGGWVARAYLGGLSGSSTAVYRLSKAKVSSLITLGTPHVSPDTALVDQTRGLLREVSNHPGCASSSLSMDGTVDITCVCSSGVSGRLVTGELEELIAATSYLPLLGRIGSDVRGDGIVPTELAFMEHPARNVVIDACSDTGKSVRHAHVLPTPWNLIDGYAPSWKLPEDILWYGSPGVLGQWLSYI